MSSGWVKLYRKCLDTGMLKNHRLWVFWSYCLLKASHQNHSSQVGFQKIKLNPGQFIFGRKQAASDLNMSEQMIRTCLNSLKKSSTINIKTTNKFSVISILNWESYQSEQPTTNHQPNQQLTNNQPTTNHKQEGEEGKNGKKKDKRSASSLPEIRSLKPDWWTTEEWEELISHRAKKKATQTPRAYNSLIKEFEIAKSKGYTANEILDAMSSGKGWSGFKAEWIKAPPASQQTLPGVIKTSGRDLVECKKCQAHQKAGGCQFEDLTGPIDCPQFY